MPLSEPPIASAESPYSYTPRSRKALLDGLDALVSRYAIYFLLVLLVCVAYRSYIGSRLKPLWYDEIFSVIVATQPNWHAMKQAMPGDGNPPLYAILARVLIHALGQSRFLIRLPSLAGFIGALVGVYVFVRRECGAGYALVAVAFVCSQPAWAYSYEARPYGLLLGFLMLGLVSWQSATRAGDSGQPRRLALCGIAAAVVGSILSHNIGIVELGLPLLIGELVRIRRSGKVDWPVLGAGAAALPAVAITIPMMHRTSTLLLDYSRAAHSSTAVDFLLNWFVYPFLTLRLLFQMNAALLLFVAFVVFAVAFAWGWKRIRKISAPWGSRIPAHIMAAVVATTLLVPITWILMMLQNGWYFARYGIGSVLGIAILGCLLCVMAIGRRSALPLALACFLFAQYCYPAVHFYRHPPQRASAWYSIYADKSGLPIVVGDPIQFLQMWWYAPDPVKNRLVYLKDVETAKKCGLVVAEAALTSEDHKFPADFQEFQSFVASEDHFLLYASEAVMKSPATVGRFRSAGFNVKLIDRFGGDKIYEVQRIP